MVITNVYQIQTDSNIIYTSSPSTVMMAIKNSLMLPDTHMTIVAKFRVKLKSGKIPVIKTTKFIYEADSKI